MDYKSVVSYHIKAHKAPCCDGLLSFVSFLTNLYNILEYDKEFKLKT